MPVVMTLIPPSPVKRGGNLERGGEFPAGDSGRNANHAILRGLFLGRIIMVRLRGFRSSRMLVIAEAAALLFCFAWSWFEQPGDVFAQDEIQGICRGDFDSDLDVDGSDLAVFSREFGRTDCSLLNPCKGDFDRDGDVDGSDLARFSKDFGRTNCLDLKYKLHGLDFGPFLKGENPDLGTVLTPGQIRERMLVIAPFTNWILTFGSTLGVEHAPRIARDFGLKVAAGAWLGRDPSANEVELQNLIAAASTGYVDIAVIGNEVLLRGDLTEDQLISYIQTFKKAVPGVPVTTADVYGELLAHPGVMAASDVIFANIYPFWEGKDIKNAAAFIHEKYRLVSAAAAGKEVIVSETGWPSCGNAVDQAVPSLENSCAFFLNFVSWARAENVKYFYFEAFDEAWKVASEGPQGACWGIWYEDANIKGCMLKVFKGETVPDNWTCRELPGGPGTPKVEFSYVPPYGSFDNLRGQVWHAAPAEHRIAVYIYVGGGWWTKPFFDAPLTSINCDGSWTCDITTGGIDEKATRIFACLLPTAYIPPSASGGALPILPCVASAQVSRSGP